jgi:hypothetical protein
MSSMAARKTHDRIESQVSRVLAELLRAETGAIKTCEGPDRGADLVVSHGGRKFAVEVKSTSSLAHVALAARQVAGYAKDAGRGVIPLVAVPFMGKAGAAACAEAGVGWLDLAGNARIVAGDLFINVQGRPNTVRQPGRKPDLFSPRSSRVVRWFLMHPDRPFTQREIAKGASMDEGYVSRIVKRMEAEMYLLRNGNGTVRVGEPGLLLEAWRERYRFFRHDVRQGHVAARSGVELARALAGAFEEEGVAYAATGLAAAWFLTDFAAFRIATFYLEKEPPARVLEKVGFREEQSGANVWLAFPDDNGVFDGSMKKSRVRCVHPVQVYLDLKDHPERSQEAAERLREVYLSWAKK